MDQAQTYAIAGNIYYPNMPIETQFWYLDSGKTKITQFAQDKIDRDRFVLEARIKRMESDKHLHLNPVRGSVSGVVTKRFVNTLMANYYSLCSFVLPVKRTITRCNRFHKQIRQRSITWIPARSWHTGHLVFAKDSFNPDDLSELIHELLCEFSLPPCGFEWINSCSKPELDSFGGGAVWITTKGFEWLSTNNWLEERRAKSDLPNPSQ